MNDQQMTCDPERIELFLGQKLCDEEQAAFELHLDDCHSCRRRLEATAAGDDIWSGVRESLAAEPLSVESGRQSALDGTTGGEASCSHAAVLGLLAPTDDDRMIGRLGTYEVVGVVGSGGMGVVLKAFDAPLNRYVAIKVLAPHLGSSGAARKRFSREAQAAAAVVHDNVMEIHGVADANGLPYLVMPYVRGPSLQRRLDERGPLALVEILRIGMQAASALAAAHAQGLVHRDVKPANILLADGVERVKLTDFGLARAADDASLTKTGIIAGTPQYMSPEQARGESIDQRSDLFSLGSALYAMCTGRAPFRAETSYGVLRRITDEEPRPIREINPDIPEWLCRIIASLMAKQPDDRFESAREVAELLEDCLAHVQQPTAVPLPEQLRDAESSANPERGRWSMRRWLAGAAFGLALLLAGVVVVLELNKGTLTIESDADDVAVHIMQGDAVVEKLSVTRAGRKVRVAAGTYRIEIDGEADGIIVENDTVLLQRRGTEVVRIVRVAESPQAPDEAAVPIRIPNPADPRGASNETGSKRAPPIVGTDVGDSIDGKADLPPTTEAETAIARLVLVFFEDRSRRAIPAVLVDAGSQTLIVTTGPAKIVPEGTPPAVDRMFLEMPGRPPLDANYMPGSTAELSIYRTDGGLTGYRPIDQAELALGDVLSAILPGSSSELLITPSAARVVALDREAELDLPDRGLQHQFHKLVEIDRMLPEGTPLFKEGKLAGLTLLGTRFLGDKANKSYVVPVDRIAALCGEAIKSSGGWWELPPNRDAEPQPKTTIAMRGRVHYFTTGAAGNSVKIAYSADGKLIAIANGDPTRILQTKGTSRVKDNWKPSAEILDAGTGKTLVSLELSIDDEDAVLAATQRVSHFEVTALAFSPDGNVLAVGTSIGQTKLYNARTGELVRSLDDEQARLSDKETPQNWSSLARAMGSVRSMAFSPDGSLLAVCGASFADFSDVFDGVERLGRQSTGPGRLKVWDVKTGTLKRDLAGHSHADAVSFSDDGSLLASAGRWSDNRADGTGVIIWDPQTGRKVRTITTEANGGTHAVAFSPEKKVVVIGSRNFDKENDTSTTTIAVASPLSGIVEWQRTIPGYANPKAFSPDGNCVLVLCGGESIRFLETRTGTVKHEIKVANSPQGGQWNDFSLPQQGTLLAIGGIDAEKQSFVEVWSLDTWSVP
ncbi:MAG: protein kinase [Planctomycetes bacterium]|nr:protein kinase [Planctomycetota bacterium]